MSRLLDTLLTPSQYGDCMTDDEAHKRAHAHYTGQALLIATPDQKKALIVAKITEALRIHEANADCFEPEFSGLVENFLIRAKVLAEGMYPR